MACLNSFLIRNIFYFREIHAVMKTASTRIRLWYKQKISQSFSRWQISRMCANFHTDSFMRFIIPLSFLQRIVFSGFRWSPVVAVRAKRLYVLWSAPLSYQWKANDFCRSAQLYSMIKHAMTCFSLGKRNDGCKLVKMQKRSGHVRSGFKRT